jgi:chemosensory pili system protein ChpA (sensor histidine kinase/response regulator)
MDDLFPESLQVVGEELAATLKDARVALENFADEDSAPQSLDRCAGLLHTARGVLRLAETYGASLLAEEMEGTCRHLGSMQRDDGGVAGVLEALGRAAIQLPSYIERILDGGRDIPLVLLPLLNDLRAARGRPLLSESTLLLLNVASPARQTLEMDGREASGEDVGKLCRDLRPGFQLALLGWIKGTDVEHNLQKMLDLAVRLEKASATFEVYRLWWVVSGVLEALLGGGLQGSVSLKRLMGQADREMKRLQSISESQFADSVPEDLLNNLLYYVARAETGGDRVDSIRKAFNLVDLVPASAEVDMVRESLSAPSAHLMRTVADAIRDDLARVKDVLDIYVRTGMEHVEELVPQVELLKKISDTLGVLGLGELRETVQAKCSELQSIVDDAGSINESDLVDMASALLSVEGQLDEQLIGLIMPHEDNAGAAGQSPPDQVDAEYGQVTQAVMRECVANLSRVREAVSQVLEHPDDRQALDAVPLLMRGITAGLLILEKEDAVGIVEGITGALQVLMRETGGIAGSPRLDLLADSIVSLEYYLETLEAGRKEPRYMLDNARRCLVALGEAEHGRLAGIEDKVISGQATTMQISEPVTQVIGVQHAAVLAGQGDRHDPELLELFIEEAGEEIETIKQKFPQWVQDENQNDCLLSVRRSFHTMKGSGRMVGAELIGEYCWNIENLLNRIINQHIERSAANIRFLERAIAALPELLEQLEVGTEPVSDIAGLIEQSVAFAQGRIPVTDEGAEIEAIESQEDAGAEEIVDRIDATLLDILSKEVRTHLAVIEDFVTASNKSMPPYTVPEELHRACHTLHGSVTMAKADVAAEVTKPLNTMIRRAFDHTVAVSESVRDVCGDAVVALGAMLAYLAEPDSNAPDTTVLRQRLQALDEEIEEMAAAEEPAEATIPPGELVSSEAPDVAPPPADERDEQFDAEIVAIYAEEAAEILDGIDASLEQFEVADADPHTLSELQRYLHTLKGGARLAGLTVMGDLSHDLETLLTRMSRGQLEADTVLKGLLRATVDALHRLREQAVDGVAGEPPPALVDRLNAVLAGETVAEVEEEEAAGIGPSEAEAAEIEATDVEVAEPDDIEEPVEEAQPDQPCDEEQEVVVESFDEEESVETVAAEEEAEEAEEVEEAEETGAGDEPADAVADSPGRIPALEQILQLARELEQPARPTDGDLANLIPASTPAPREAAAGPERREVARVDSALLENLLNNAGEISIFHSRLSQQMSQVQFNLDELGQTVVRLRDQLRNLETATEAQILYLHHSEIKKDEDFDPLELDRYSRIQQLSLGLGETASDVNSLKDLLHSLISETEALLVQQARTANELQDGLMRTRMVRFQHHSARLGRLVRQTASEQGKNTELILQGSDELDRQVLERMLPPFEHLLRNAVIHGIELPEEREAAGKPATGNVIISLHRESSEVVIDVSDDGRGLDIEGIKKKAIDANIVDADSDVTDEEAMQLILRPGFSTADHLTQAAGRGIGMDVVASEISKLGGTLRIESRPGTGTRFSIRLPFTLAVTQALIVRAGPELYALPLPTVEGIIRVSRSEFETMIAEPEPKIEYGGQVYYFRHLGQFLDLGPSRIAEDQDRISLILVQAGENSAALVTDEMLDSREIVVKSVGEQLATIRGISGATILGDGRIVVILDVGALVRSSRPPMEPAALPIDYGQDQTLVLVVDDSITMRRVTQRLLERNGMRVVTAKDGVEAIGVLQSHMPDIILLDVEMPRMDGYEFASHVRNNPLMKDLPIIMVTSRVSDKHKARAIELGVNDYLGKPYQEQELLEAVQHQLNRVQASEIS